MDTANTWLTWRNVAIVARRARPRILLVGANGQLGQELLKILHGQCELIASTRSGSVEGSAAASEALDLEHPSTIQRVIGRLTPDAVINAAAYNRVDQAEQEPERAAAINVDAVAAMAGSCAAHGARLIHYSSDYVFSGNGTRPWREGDKAAPVNVYGATKLAGEAKIRQSGCEYLTFRIAWLYAAHSHNFLQTMLRFGRERAEIQVVDDQFGTPTPARWVAAATRKVLFGESVGSGTWHLAPSGQASWFEFAEAIFRHATAMGLLRRAPRVTPTPSSQFGSLAQRPRYSVLDTRLAREELGLKMPPWEAGLLEVLREYQVGASCN